MEISHKCRVCLGYSSCCTSLFSKQNGTSVAQMVSFCAGVQITEEDDLPPYVCAKCSKEATFAYMFVNKCRKSDAELRTQQILGRQPDEASDEQSDVFENVPYSNSHTDMKEELLVEDRGIETLEDTADEETVPNWQDHTEGNGFEDVVEDMNDCELREEEYLHESDMDKEVQLVIEPQEEGTIDEQDLTPQLIRSLKSKVDTYVCCHTDCTVTFKSKRMLQEHFLSLHRVDEKESDGTNEVCLNRCGNCHQPFPSESELSNHVANLQHKQAALIRRRIGRPQLYPNVFEAPVKICCGCFERFPTMGALLEHSEAVHAIRKTATDPTRPVQCQICYKLFRSEAHVRTHRIAVYKPRKYCCNICDSSFLTPSRLAIHQVLHESERKYVCTDCGACLKTEQNLKMHALLHREKREVCKTCGLRFHRKSNLKMHQRTHDDIYYHLCTHCPKKLKTMAQLREHLKVHTKEKPYECRYCEKRFRYYTDRARHEMGHTGNYPFECGACLKKFTRNLSYYRHVNKCKQDDAAPSVANSECGNDA